MAINNDWLKPLSAEFRKDYYRALYAKVKEEYEHHQIFPASQDLFKAFELTPLSQVKVVILGQDPYHGDGQAEGLCFSVKPGIDTPPSLQNIYKELRQDEGCYIPDNGCLVPWAKQGVLLLNTVLTVRAHAAFSHRGIGWEQFTDAAIRALNEQNRPIVFMLWGKPAQEKAKMLTNPMHLILKAPHPSPLSASRGFFGCRHFSQCNAFLTAHGISPINWQIPNLYGPPPAAGEQETENSEPDLQEQLAKQYRKADAKALESAQQAQQAQNGFGRTGKPDKNGAGADADGFVPAKESEEF